MKSGLRETVERWARVLGGQALVAGSSLAMQLATGATLERSAYGLWAGQWLLIMLAEAVLQAWVIVPLQAHGKDTEDNAFAAFGQVLALMLGLSVPWVGWLWGQPVTAELSVCGSAYLLLGLARKQALALGHTHHSLRMEAGQSVVQLMVAGMFLFVGIPVATGWWVLAGGYGLIFLATTRIHVSPRIVGEGWRRCLPLGLPQSGAALLTWYAGNGLMLAAAATLGPATLGTLRLLQTLMGGWNLLFQSLENYLPSRLAGESKRVEFAQKRTKQLSVLLGLSLSTFQGLVVIGLFILVPERLASVLGGDAGMLLVGFTILYALLATALPWRITLRLQGYVYEQLLVAGTLATANLMLGPVLCQAYGLKAVLGLLLLQPVAYLGLSFLLFHFHLTPLCRSSISFLGKRTRSV